MTDSNSSELQTFLLSTLNMVYGGLNNQPVEVQQEFAALLKAQKISSEESAYFRAIFEHRHTMPSMPTSISEKIAAYPNLQKLVSSQDR